MVSLMGREGTKRCSGGWVLSGRQLIYWCKPSVHRHRVRALFLTCAASSEHTPCQQGQCHQSSPHTLTHPSSECLTGTRSAQTCCGPSGPAACGRGPVWGHTTYT